MMLERSSSRIDLGVLEDQITIGASSNQPLQKTGEAGAGWVQSK
jgi:hypothetical protein